MADIKQTVSSEDKVWGAVGYLWILSLVALAARKNNDFIRFHASQGALLFAISLALMLIPGIGWFINLLVAIVAIVGIIKALQGERWPAPLVGGMAKQFGDWIIKTAKL